MRYAQEKSGQKLHLVFNIDDNISQPICGKPIKNGYRMTCNLPLGNACKNCRKVYNANGGKKTKVKFLDSMKNQDIMKVLFTSASSVKLGNLTIGNVTYGGI